MNPFEPHSVKLHSCSEEILTAGSANVVTPQATDVHHLTTGGFSIKAGPPLEAILVIFGRRALIFFLFESSWKKMKNDATFVRMRIGDHLGDAKMSKKGTSLRRI